MKGVLICGGSGTRLRPLTEVTNKSLLPVYDQPLIYYPLQILLKAGINDIIIISGPEHLDQMSSFLQSGSRFGCRFSYRVQEEPKGIAQALGMAEDFVGNDSVCAILGDNVYFDNLSEHIRQFQHGGHVFVKSVPDAARFGVAEINGTQVTNIEEKPPQPKSDLAVTGCYVYDNRCFQVIRDLQPSARGEFEITDVSNWYVKQGQLQATILQDEWVDAGTVESLYRAATIVRERNNKPADAAQPPVPAQTTEQPTSAPTVAPTPTTPAPTTPAPNPNPSPTPPPPTPVAPPSPSPQATAPTPVAPSASPSSTPVPPVQSTPAVPTPPAPPAPSPGPTPTVTTTPPPPPPPPAPPAPVPASPPTPPPTPTPPSPSPTPPPTAPATPPPAAPAPSPQTATPSTSAATPDWLQAPSTPPSQPAS